MDCCFRESQFSFLFLTRACHEWKPCKHLHTIHSVTSSTFSETKLQFPFLVLGILFRYCTVLWHSPSLYLLCSEAACSAAHIPEKTFYSFRLWLMFPFFLSLFSLLRPLTKSYQEVVRSVLTSSTSSGANRRQTLKDLQEEFSNLYSNIRLFEKGVKHFTGT